MQLGIKLDQLNSLAEEQTMLAENLQNWPRSEVNAGRQEGKLECIAEQLLSAKTLEVALA